jgi:hypothetical protein
MVFAADCLVIDNRRVAATRSTVASAYGREIVTGFDGGGWCIEDVAGCRAVLADPRTLTHNGTRISAIRR